MPKFVCSLHYFASTNRYTFQVEIKQGYKCIPCPYKIAITGSFVAPGTGELST